jgi:hypothetical protein
VKVVKSLTARSKPVQEEKDNEGEMDPIRNKKDDDRDRIFAKKCK